MLKIIKEILISENEDHVFVFLGKPGSESLNNTIGQKIYLLYGKNQDFFRIVS